MGIIENFKDVLKIADAANNLDLYKKLAELQTAVLGLQQDNQTLKGRVNELSGQLSLKEKMRFEAPFYYQEGDDTPFCSACFEARDRQAIHVVRRHDYGSEVRWECLECKNSYMVQKKRYSQPNTPGFGSSGGPDEWMR